ncbi:helix-hairpin-helix domain-containing protein, partial [Anaerotignum sp.]
MKTDLQKIPYVGKETEKDLILLGFGSIASLKGADPEAMYEKECALKGVKIDRCQLYV